MASAYPNEKDSPYYYGRVYLNATTPVRIVGANSNRRGLIVINNSEKQIYIGFDNGVDAATGTPINPSGVWNSADFHNAFIGEVWGLGHKVDTDARVHWWNG